MSFLRNISIEKSRTTAFRKNLSDLALVLHSVKFIAVKSRHSATCINACRTVVWSYCKVLYETVLRIGRVINYCTYFVSDDPNAKNSRMRKSPK